MDVLEIFPIHFLFEEAFYQYMTQNNERIVRLQTQTILQLEKYFLDPQVSNAIRSSVHLHVSIQ